jgi:hypothetical protein
MVAVIAIKRSDFNLTWPAGLARLLGGAEHNTAILQAPVCAGVRSTLQPSFKMRAFFSSYIESLLDIWAELANTQGYDLASVRYMGEISPPPTRPHP